MSFLKSKNLCFQVLQRINITRAKICTRTEKFRSFSFSDLLNIHIACCHLSTYDNRTAHCYACLRPYWSCSFRCMFIGINSQTNFHCLLIFEVFAGFSAESLSARIIQGEAKALIVADGCYRGNKAINLKALADHVSIFIINVIAQP